MAQENLNIEDFPHVCECGERYRTFEDAEDCFECLEALLPASAHHMVVKKTSKKPLQTSKETV